MPAPKEETMNLVVRKMIPASREEVFSAWTDPKSIRQWMCPGDITEAEAQLDVRVGGAYRIIMKGKDKNHHHSGVYQVVDRPARLVFTWNTAGTGNQEILAANQETLVTVELHARGESTELVLTHERFPTSEARDRYQGGWSTIADKLAAQFAKK